MHQQPRLSELNRHQVEKYNEIKRLLKRGKILAAMLNPAIIKEHNRVNPDVAQITHGSDEVCLDSLALLYSSDGISARKFFRDTIYDTVVKDDSQGLDMSGMSRRDRLTAMGVHDD